MGLFGILFGLVGLLEGFDSLLTVLLFMASLVDLLVGLLVCCLKLFGLVFTCFFHKKIGGEKMWTS